MTTRSSNLILLPPVSSKENFLAGFWTWVERLSTRDYRLAFESLYWPRRHWFTRNSWTPAVLEKQITTFFGGPDPWFAIVPNERIVGVVAAEADFRGPSGSDKGWLLAQVPLTTSGLDPKDDAIPLAGLGTSFFVHAHGEHFVLSLEIFHA